MRLTERGRLTSRCIDALGEDRAQSTVEAAVLIPSFLVLVLLLLQPVCVLYTRAVMECAAGETARLMATSPPGGEEACRAFAMRRLSAVPNLEVFHAGGRQSWKISLGYASDTGGEVAVGIEGAVRPLPILGAFVGAFGESNARGDVVIRVDVGYRGTPEWLEGDYETWIAAWEG